MNIYTSIYKFNEVKVGEFNSKPNYESAIIDKIFFDLDSDKCYEDMINLCEYCVRNNYKHTVFFSGKGFHIYIFTDANNLVYKKNALTLAQRYFIDLLNLNVDEHIIGDLARITRVPNTFNMRRRRYCIPLSDNDLNLTYEEIKEKAKKQNFIKNYIIGDKLFDISLYDKKPTFEGIDIEDININVNLTKLKQKNIPNCIAKILSLNERKGWKRRAILILFLRDKGYLLDEVINILKENLTIDEYYHCVKQEQQPQYLFHRHDLLAYSCDRLIKEHYCDKPCDKKDKVLYI